MVMMIQRRAISLNERYERVDYPLCELCRSFIILGNERGFFTSLQLEVSSGRFRTGGEMGKWIESEYGGALHARKRVQSACETGVLSERAARTP